MKNYHFFVKNYQYLQKLNLQNVTLPNSTTVKVSTREAKKYRKDIKSKEDKVTG